MENGTLGEMMTRWLGALLCLATTSTCAFGAGIGAGIVVDVIVNPDESRVSIDRDLLRGIFSMRVRAWPGGEPIRVFVLPDDDQLSDDFCRDLLGTYPYVLRAAWDRLVFTGTGLAPTVVKSEEEMRRRVLATPGAIGYVRHPSMNRPVSGGHE
jgi:ABC-type phosphate transport system substrate-binding protein